jgi:hypothetical protein
MGTRRRLLIKNIDKEILAERIKNTYSIGRTAELDYEYREIFLDEMNYVLILFDAYLENWTEIELDFNESVEEHDTFLKNISKEFKTTVLFGYEQTTSGSARLLVLKNGKTIRSIYQKFQLSYKFIMEHNFGMRLESESHFEYPSLGEEITEGHKFLSFDEIQKMFSDAGFTGKERTSFDNRYLHLEYLK